MSRELRVLNGSRRRFRILFLPIVLGLVSSCAVSSSHRSTTPESIVRSGQVSSEIIDTKTGEAITLIDFYAALQTSRVVYVAERHDVPIDHGVQYKILRALHRADPTIHLGMEMFQLPFQSAIDAWVGGRVDEDELRRLTEYDRRWGFDFGMVRPILEYVRVHCVPVVALNAAQEVTRTVARAGLASLSPKQASRLAVLDLQDEAHRALVMDALGAHMESKNAARLERLYTVQVIWDETMAQRVWWSLQQQRSPSRIVVFAGRMHVAQGLGIPKRAGRRGATPYTVVMPVGKEELATELKKGSADYFWVHP